MMLGGHVIPVNMMTWPDKSDFRLRNGELRDAGNVGDIMRIVKVEGNAQFNYVVEIVGPKSPTYAAYAGMCNHAVRNSKKRWGYH